MNDSSQNVAGAADTSTTPKMRNELKAVLDVTLPQTPSQFGEHLIKGKWGQGIDPQTAMLVTLDYNYKGHPARDGVQQGQVASSQSLLQALLLNHQAVGDGRFAENAFGLYTPPETGPSVQIVQNVDEFADHGSGNHQTYEGIYRRTIPQTYGPLTQISVRPADFKKWVWELDLQAVYKTYLDQAWPSDEVVVGTASCALRTSAKAAFVMTAWLQRHELRLSEKGLALAMQAAGLPVDQPWETLKIEQLQASVGSISGDANLTAQGNSVASLLAGSNGELKTLINQGQVSKMLLEMMGLNVANIVITKLFGDKQVQLNCMATDFAVTNGLARTRYFVVDTDEALINIAGTINLANEQLDMRIDPKTKGLRLFSLRSPFYVRGPFSQPDVSVDKGVLAMKAGSAIALAAVAPVAALLPLINTGPGEDSPCGRLVALAKEKPTAPPPGKTKKR